MKLKLSLNQYVYSCIGLYAYLLKYQIWTVFERKG